MRKHLAKNNFGQFTNTEDIGNLAEKLSREFFTQYPDVDFDDLISIFLPKMLWAKTVLMMEEVRNNCKDETEMNQIREEN